ncbi:MAG TPA: hypothetical protein VJ922_06620 [Actinomycetota bacterium]|nr:hypothetical protein [Actinomycetota bacterium]
MARRSKTRSFLKFLAILLGTIGVMLGSALLIPGSWGMYVALSVPFVLIVALVVIPGFTLPDDYLARWSKAHGVTINEANREVVKRYLLHGRRMRTAGALGGYLGYTIYGMVTHDELPFGWITATFGGYLLGAAAAEIWTLRPQPGRVRAASLAPRKLTDYVPGFAVVGLRLVPVLTVLAVATWPLVRDAADNRRGSFYIGETGRGAEADIGSVIGWTIASVILALFIEATARRIVRRPQPVVSGAHIDVDDAIRSTALHGLFGAGLALLLGSLARNLSELQGFLNPDWVQMPFVVVMVFAAVATPFAWLYLGIDQPWIVRRNAAMKASTA